jgi:hypothetical protein
MKTPQRKLRHQITLSREATEKLHELAKSRGLTLSTMIEQLIRDRPMIEQLIRDRPREKYTE